MKKIYSLLLLLVAGYTSFGQTIYSENMGVPTATTLIPAYVTGTAPATFQNGAPIVYSGTADVRTSLPSSYTGASAGGNVFITNTAGKYFQIDGINTSAYSAANLQLSFGLNATATVQPIVEFSTNASATTPTWTAITYTNIAGWQLITIPTGVIPSSSTLSLRFSQATGTMAQMRIDDVRVFNFNASCTLILGAPTTLCDAVTFGIDTYTVTIPYTGGTTGAYTITPSSGTVGGDNPATVAAGNITVSGITEGTNFTLNITKGACSYDTNATAPECKPINTLPYSESFPYAVGSALGAQQKWSNINTGDDILSTSGSLTHSGVTSSGNSITFSGSGKEAATSFTATTSGTIYAAFLFSVTDMANLTGTSPETYFAGLTGATNSDYKGRIFLKKAGPTQYQIGFDIPSTTTNYDATLRNVGDVIYIVIGYNFATNSLNAWINPVNGNASTFAFNPTTPFTTLGGFTLRQDDNLLTPTINFDELRIVTTLSELGLTLGVNQNNIAGLKMYPNPVSNGTLFIETAANAEKTITVYDVLGKQVLNTTTSNSFVNVSALHTGVYIVNITEEGKTASRKLVIR